MRIKVSVEGNELPISEIVSQKEALKFAQINYPELVCDTCESGVLYSYDEDYFCCSNCENKSKIFVVDPVSPFKPVEFNS